MELRRFVIVIALLWSALGNVSAQTEMEALLFSQTGITGSARALGMAGAFSAVGADITAGTLNPAGLGLYRKSEFTITPILRNIQNDAAFLDNGGETSEIDFGIGGFGFAFHNPRYVGFGRERQRVEKGLKSFTFAFGYNQLENYSRQVDATGFNPRSSITDLFADLAFGTTNNQLVDGDGEPLAVLAWDAFAINPLFNSNDEYFPAVNGGNIQQTLRIAEEGRTNEWFISLAGNIDDVFFIGASVGIRSLRYDRDFILIEEDINDVHNDFQDDPSEGLNFPMDRLDFVNNFSTRGTGFNGQLGIIYRPVDALRVGISFQSPTFLSLEDTFEEEDTQIAHDHESFFTRNDTSVAISLPAGQFSYNLSTPYRLTVGLMYLFGKNGFVSADVELLDYSTAELSSEGSISDPNFYSFDIENRNIDELFQLSLSYRLGGEYRMDPFRFRAGVGLTTSPLSTLGAQYQDFDDLNQINELDGNRLMFSAGIGIRQPSFFVDVSWVNQRQQDKLTPYRGSDFIFSPTLVNEKISNNFALTLGLFF